MTRLKSTLLTMILSATVAAVALPAAAHCPDGKAHSHKAAKKKTKKTAVACNCPPKAVKTKHKKPAPRPAPAPEPVDYPLRSTDTYFNDRTQRSRGVDLYATSWSQATVTTRVVSRQVYYMRATGGHVPQHRLDCRDPHHEHIW